MQKLFSIAKAFSKTGDFTIDTFNDNAKWSKKFTISHLENEDMLPHVFVAGILSSLVLSTRIEELHAAAQNVSMSDAEVKQQARVDTSELLSLMSTVRSSAVSDSRK